MLAEENIKHAIIGCGRVAHNHIYGVAKYNQASIVAFCDLVHTRTQNISSDYPRSNVTNNYLDIVLDDDIDSVSICTDHGSHFEIAKACIESGKHVLIEKPVTISHANGLYLKRLADFSALVVSVVLQHRFDPVIKFIKQLVEAGHLGRVTCVNGMVQCCKDEEYYSSWRGKLISEGGSALINQGIHTLDLMQWIAGSILSAKSYSAKNKFRFLETEDTISSALKFDHGAIGSITCTTTSIVEWDSYIDLIGTKGRILFTTDFPNRIRSIEIADKYLADKLKKIENKRPEPSIGKNYYGVSHITQINNFFNAIKGIEALEVGLSEGLEVLSAVEKIYLSAKEG